MTSQASEKQDKVRRFKLARPAKASAPVMPEASAKTLIGNVIAPEVVTGATGQPVGPDAAISGSVVPDLQNSAKDPLSDPRKGDRRNGWKGNQRRLNRTAENNKAEKPGPAEADPVETSPVKSGKDERKATRRRTEPTEASAEDLAAMILGLEQQARQAQSDAELGYMLVNASRSIIKFRQAVLLIKKGGRQYQVSAVSSLSEIDRNATFIRWMERLVTDIAAGDGEGKVIVFSPPEQQKGDDPDADIYPFKHMALFPLKLRNGMVHAQLLCAREDEWPERDLTIGARLSETFAHAWEALTGPARVQRRLKTKTMIWVAAAMIMVGAMFIPVPLTVLAPAEVTAANAFVVAAPIDGVIEKIAVLPNSVVKKGDLLFSMSDTDLRNRLDLARQSVEVASTRYQQAERTSFADPQAKRELALARSELNLKVGELKYATELLEKAEIRAPRNGLVLFDDRDSWTGRPVATGERIMRISNPENVEISVSLPVDDAIVLEKGTRVRLFLDADPLKSLEAKLSSSSYHARPDDENVLAYQAVAQFSDPETLITPRIGLRGTAQLFGRDVALGYFLFRKPLSVVRQWIGY